MALLLACASAAAPQQPTAPPAAAAPSAPAPTTQIRISQTVMTGSSLRIYLESRSQSGDHVPLTTSGLSISHGNQPLSVTRLTPFGLSGEGVALVALVDLSQSIAAQVETLRQTLLRVVDGLGETDRMALLTFGNSVNFVSEFTGDKALLRSKLSPTALKAEDRRTQLFDALDRGVQYAHAAIANVPNRRVLLIASDGIDDGSALRREDVARRLGEFRVPIFALGLVDNFKGSMSELEVLRGFAYLSAGTYKTARIQDLEKTWGDLQSAARDVTVVELACSECPTDGNAYPLRVRWSSGSATFEDSVPLQANWPVEPGLPLYIYVTGGALGLILLGAIVWMTRSRRRRQVIRGRGPMRPEDALGRGHDEVTVPPDRIMMATPGRRQGAAAIPTTPVVAAPHMMPVQLVIVYGSQRGKSYEARIQQTRPTTVGKHQTCEVVIAGDPRVEDRHFELLLDERNNVVARNVARSGTLVDGTRLASPTTVADGTLLRAGATEMRLVVVR